MANVKHTPGPWWTDGEYHAEECGVAVIAAREDCGPLPGNPTRGMVAFVSELLPDNAERAVANARLIAAAPDLLAFVRKAANYLEYLPGLLEEAQMSGHAGNCTIIAKEARALIAKAEPRHD